MKQLDKIIIGSTAIKHWFPSFNREPSDLDYAIKNKSNKYLNSKGVEYLYNPVLFKYIDNNIKYLTPDLLYTLKVSHLSYDTNWRKHMYDANYLANKGCTINDKLLKELREFWKDYLPKVRRSDLNLSKEQFFNNAVNNNVLEHDDLHLIINKTPIYTKVLKENKEVELDVDKYINLTEEEKLDFVREEVYVMAYERFKKLPYYHAYSRMLEKFIKQHIPEFAIPHAVKNYHKLVKPKINFIKKLEEGIKSVNN